MVKTKRVFTSINYYKKKKKRPYYPSNLNCKEAVERKTLSLARVMTYGIQRLNRNGLDIYIIHFQHEAN